MEHNQCAIFAIQTDHSRSVLLVYKYEGNTGDINYGKTVSDWQLGLCLLRRFEQAEEKAQARKKAERVKAKAKVLLAI